MNTVLVIARKEFQSVFRNRLFVTIALLFLGMSILSVWIGSTTKHAEMRLYNELVVSLTAAGNSALPAPPQIHTLTILSNLSEYVAIIGAILAVILGYNSLIEEKESGGLKLILSRPVFRDRLLTGKLLGGAAVIGLLLGLAFVFNLLLLVLVGGIWPTMGEVGRLFTFVLMAFAYMLIFLSVSLMLSVKLPSASQVFLISLVLWVVFSFVLPQMADTQMVNSTVVNSVTGVASQIPQDTALSQTLNFLSPTWHLRHIGSQLLEATTNGAGLTGGALATQSVMTLLLLLVPSVLFGALAYALFLRDETLVLE
ncbi:MAG: ABC transporter permease [Caldilineaceae bacterium]|nr:ABC transporter permease [Caldilineaceae bacterium]HRJ40923.1 ABC transporter permease subunit [Caldilineaceae bacterium]